MSDDKDWKSGENMSDWVRERYYKISRARFRTRSGVCYGMAGTMLLIGTSTAIISSAHRAVFITVFAVLAALCIAAALWVRHTGKKELLYIVTGDFSWKYDSVKELLPDRYPKTCKIVTETVDDPCLILQGFFYFKNGTPVYVVKRKTLQGDSELQAFIA